MDLPKFRGWWRSGMTENQVEQLILPSFPRLSSLTIRGCERLTSMPRCPNIDKELTLESASWKSFEHILAPEETSPSTIPTIVSVSSYPLSKLPCLNLDRVTDLEYFPDDRIKGLASLKQLHIWDCPGLKYLTPCIQYLTSLENLEIESCEELEGIKWPEAPALTSLRFLKLQGLPKLKHLLSPGIQHLTSLEELSIERCEELQVSNDDSIEWQWQAPTSLRSLELRELPKLETLPGGLQFLTTLEHLHIWECDNFTALPNWICKLCSLKTLVIGGCFNFKPVPCINKQPHLFTLHIYQRQVHESKGNT